MSARSFAPALLALCGTLTLANWYLRPDRIVAWTSVLVMLAVMTAAWRWTRGRSTESEISTGVIFGSAIISLAQAAALASAFGLRADRDLPERVTMIVLGAYFVVSGNAMPKTLKPLSALRGDPAAVQATRRVAGWMWVMTGLAFILIWLTAPLGIATAASMGVLMAGAAFNWMRACCPA